MKKLLENSRFLATIAVFACLAAALAACVLGVIRTLKLFTVLEGSATDSSYAVVTLVEIADIFLLAASLLIVGLSLYELFVETGSAAVAGRTQFCRSSRKSSRGSS